MSLAVIIAVYENDFNDIFSNSPEFKLFGRIAEELKIGHKAAADAIMNFLIDKGYIRTALSEG